MSFYIKYKASYGCIHTGRSQSAQVCNPWTLHHYVTVKCVGPQSWLFGDPCGLQLDTPAILCACELPIPCLEAERKAHHCSWGYDMRHLFPGHEQFGWWLRKWKEYLWTRETKLALRANSLCAFVCENPTAQQKEKRQTKWGCLNTDSCWCWVGTWGCVITSLFMKIDTFYEKRI